MQLDKQSCYVSVGRVAAYEEEKLKENGAKVLPVSCTVVTVKDSLDSITDSWDFLAQAIKNGAGVAIDLSGIRSKGTVGRGGMVSQGVCSWISVYSEIVNSVRQGRGGEKKGAALIFLNSDHPDALEFLKIKRHLIPHVSRAIYLQPGCLENPEFTEALIEAMQKGDIFLSKIRYNSRGERLYCNLCTEVYIKSKMTCILGQINLGLIEHFEDIPEAFKDGMTKLIATRENSLTDIKRQSKFNNPEDDKQVGLGVIGLANMLANFGIKYTEIVSSLAKVRQSGFCADTPADILASNLYIAYAEASKVARHHHLERAFAIAPTATVSWKQKDSKGFTTTPEISPPVCNSVTKIARRDSAEGKKTTQYPFNVEVANTDVLWYTYDALVDEWQAMQDVDGLAHAISHNWWTTKPVTKKTLQSFLNSRRWSSYYMYPVVVDQGDKTNTVDPDLQVEDMESYWGEPEYCEACAG